MSDCKTVAVEALGREALEGVSLDEVCRYIDGLREAYVSQLLSVHTVARLVRQRFQLRAALLVQLEKTT